MATGFDPVLNPPFTLLEPTEQRVPFVFNSPHSGRNYTPHLLEGIRLDRFAIRRSEDFRVEELFGGALGHGCPLLSANFPRAFLDVNREPYELDPRMIDGDLPDYANTRSARVAGGLGTIARIVSETEEIYRRKLALAEVMERIEVLYKPYHAALRDVMSTTRQRFGYAVLVDCHSMPSAQRASTLASRPDFVIGDRYGASCAPELSWAAAEFLSDLGYKVEINKPYAGGFITEHYGRPEQGFHAIQIEVNRGLYMNEKKLQKNARFDSLASDITRFVGRFVALRNQAMAGSLRHAAE